MVAVRKPNKLEPVHLNKGIVRNHYPTPTVEDIAPKLTKATVFSVVDAKDGFLQVVLDEPSSYLTTFWTDAEREAGLKLNKKKLRFKLSKVAYMGHILGSEGLQADSEKIQAI